MLWRETELWSSGYKLVAGVDEAGRGPLAGPVVAAAVILRPGCDIAGAMDSKTLSPGEREAQFIEISAKSLAMACGAVSTAIIDRIGILEATLLAMKRALSRLQPNPDYILIDGNRLPKGLLSTSKAIVGGDASVRCIAAASIIAKVIRDRLMIRLGRLYPQYGFEKHKGYGTPQHLEALASLGPTPHHRFSFQPVRQTRMALGDGSDPKAGLSHT